MRRKEQPTGMRPSEVAEEQLRAISLKVSINILKRESFRAVEVPFGDERTTLLHLRRGLREGKGMLPDASESDRVRRSEFYDSTNDIAFFQYFQSHDSVAAQGNED